LFCRINFERQAALFLFPKKGDKTMLVIANETFQSIQQLDRATETERERKQLKYSMLDRISEALGRAFRNARKVAAVIDEITYKATDRGYSFNGRETLSEKVGVSLRTVDNAIKLLKQSAEVIVAYRENPGSNGVKTPVIIFKSHPNFERIARLLNLQDCEVVCEVENPSNPTETSDSSPKKVATYSLPLKQEKYNNISNTDKIKAVIEYKINDAMRKGTTITYISSYINRVFRSLTNQALIAEQSRKRPKRPVEASPDAYLARINWID
jgi:hypothetical protein